MKKLALPILLSALLAACSSTGTDTTGAKVEDRSGGAGGRLEYGVVSVVAQPASRAVARRLGVKARGTLALKREMPADERDMGSP